MITNRLRNLFSANAKRGAFRAESNTIYLYDMIVGSDAEAAWYGGVSPEAFAKQLAGMNGDVHLRINSPGGDVFGGRAIAQAMREYKGGDVLVHVDGYAASIASIIAVTGKKVIMAPGAFMMIHKAWTISLGNADELLATAALLEKIDGTLAETYASRAGGKPEEFLAMMAAETWFTAQDAVDLKLADELAAEPEDKSASAAAQWDLSAYGKAPAAVREAAPPTAPSAPAIDQAAELTELEAAKAESERQHRQRQHAVAMLLKSA